jgi:chromate transport protein ChrA
MGSLSDICFVLGVGLAIGMLAGTTGTHGSARGRMTLLAAVIALAIGALLAGSADLDRPVGAIFCLLGAVAACVVVSEVVGAAGQREGTGAGALAFLVLLAALVVLAISFVFAPLVLVLLAALIWVGISRHRRAQRKHAGLRVLR